MSKLLSGGCFLLEAVTHGASFAGLGGTAVAAAALVLGSAGAVLAAAHLGGLLFEHASEARTLAER